MKRQVPPMIIADNKIHIIINLLVLTNVNNIFMVEKQNRFLTKIIPIGKCEKHGSIHSEIPTPYIKEVPVIPFLMNRNIWETSNSLF